MDRRLFVWTSGHEPPTEAEKSAAAAPEGGKGKKGKGKGSAAQEPAAADQDGKEDDDDNDQETPLMAFERRAAATLGSLSAQQAAAEWKAPSEEELEILNR